MHTTVKSALALAAAVASIAASAQGWSQVDTRDIDARRVTQQQRIEQGIERGQLTRFEARELRRNLHDIARVEDQAKADNRVTRGERRQLLAMLDRNDARIAELRHDRDGRRGA